MNIIQCLSKLKPIGLLPILLSTIGAMPIYAQTSVIYTTADHTNLRLTASGSLTFKELKQPLETQICVFVDPQTKFQSVTGIGGTITDAAAETYATLSKDVQKEFLKAYYDKDNGIGYSLARTTIHSSDFSSGSYTYVKENDAALQSFNLEHDQKYRIPLLKQCIVAAGGKLPLFVSPWSPPAFMKSNHDMLRGGKLLPAFRSAWANYFVKFIKGYEKEGIPVWGLTVQNEPMATQKWESCIFNSEEERDFIK
jgi:glucosylceramidase